MLLTSVVVTSAVFVSGVRLYREKKRHTKLLWMRDERRRVKPQLPGHRSNLVGSARNAPIAAKHELKRDKIHRFFGQRLEQLSEFSQAEVPQDIRDAERQMTLNVSVSIVCLGLTTVGGLFYPPLALLSVPGLFYLTSIYVKGAYHLIRREGKVAVALLDVLSFGGAFVTGHYFASSLAYSLFYFSRVLLIKTEHHSQQSLQHVFGQNPNFVWIQQGHTEVEIAFDRLQIGDIMVVQTGQTISIDGTITGGVAQIDQRMLTGESQPVEKGSDDLVFASTLVLSGKIYIRVEKTGQDTVAAQIGDILHATADFKSNILSRGEQIINQGAVPTLALSALALPLLGINSALATLYSSFGFHMRSAAPISVLNFLNLASQNGILIKDGRSLELFSKVDTFVFDKTGTLTENEPHVSTIYTLDGRDENELLTYAASAEHKQTHPIARAIQKTAHIRQLHVPPVGESQVELGYGLKVRTCPEQGTEEKWICVGSGRFLAREGIPIPEAYQSLEDVSHDQGHSLVYVAVDQQFSGAIELVPTVRPEIKPIIEALHQRNIEVIIISGDAEKPTRKLAEALSVDHYFAETLPQNKAHLVEQLQKEGKMTCFVGDGINDSIALKKAHVSISLRGASTAATDMASIVLMDESLKQLILLLDLATDLDTNLSNSVVLTVVPGMICVGGVFFFHLGLVSALIWCNLALAASLSNAMLPLMKYQVFDASSHAKHGMRYEAPMSSPL